MQRRTFFRRLLGSLGAAATGTTLGTRTKNVVIQESPLAGFQFHDGEAVWDSLMVGQRLALVREPVNSHDPDAVAVHLGDRKLGYVPRAENSAVAQMLDRGEKLDARISRLSESDSPWERIRITIALV